MWTRYEWQVCSYEEEDTRVSYEEEDICGRDMSGRSVVQYIYVCIYIHTYIHTYIHHT